MGDWARYLTEIAIRIAEAWALVAALQLGLWLVQQRTRNAGIVDVGWAGAFALVVAVFAWHATTPFEAWLPIAVVVALWSLRLTAYLISRGAARSPEEGRYVDLRSRWAPHAARKFFVFFQAQAALTGVLSLAFVVPFVVHPWDTGWLRGVGIAIAAIGILGETVADAQLAQWRRDPANRRRVCETGLWAYSRHPNYFFEWCVWVGFAIYGLAFAPAGLLALAAQAIILASIFGVTGIPPTENQAIRSKGDAYREYQKRVSRFVPMPPKSRSSDA
jgi:steroid 5-alpha reductase family enzyme